MDSKKRKVHESSPDMAATVDVKNLLDALTKEQLLCILQQAVKRHPDLRQEVTEFAEKDPVHRKLFVRGLGVNVSSDAVHNVFSRFGELEEVVVVADKATGKCKGYGFVTFKHIDGARRALEEPSKKIDGRMTVCQLASTGPAHNQEDLQSLAGRKIFVGSVPVNVDTNKLLNHFARYGEIEEGPLGLDKQTGKSKGYAFFVYKSAESAKRAVEEPLKVVDGHQIFCKLNEPPKQRASAFEGQLEGTDLATLQARAAIGAVQSFPYGALNTNSLQGSLSINPALNLAINPGLAQSLNPALLAQGLHTGLSGTLNSSLSPSLALNSSLGQSLSGSLNPSLYSSLLNTSFGHGGSYGLTHDSSPLSTSLGMSSYGLGAYDSQIRSLGSQSAHSGLVGGSPYDTSIGFLPSQASVLASSGILSNPQVLPSTGSRGQSFPSYL